jgi:membrane-bound lytic murein transglycosylase B
VIVSRAGSSAEKAVIEPTATFSPADATATWVAFRPEMDRLTAAARRQQIVEATIAAATAGAEQPDLATDARPVSEAIHRQWRFERRYDLGTDPRSSR